MRIATILLSILLAGLLASPAQAQSENYPTRAIRIIVPIGPGSANDLMNRTLAEQLTAQFGQPVVVENRPGADGVVAAQVVLSSPADGYTLLAISPGILIINTLITDNPPYQVGDFTPVVNMSRIGAVVAAAPNVPFTSMKEMVAAARRAPGTLTMGTYGSIYRIGAQLLENRLGVEFNHVAYKGFGPTTTDLSGGAINLSYLDGGASAPMIRSGKLRGLAAVSSERLPALPDVPTLRELGITEAEPPIWVGLAVRKGTPGAITRKLEAALMQAMKSDAWHDLLKRQGNLEPWVMGGQAFSRQIAGDVEFFRKAVASPATR